MSGGHFNYKQHKMNGISDELEHLIRDNPYNYPADILLILKQARKNLLVLSSLIHSIDLFVSYDTGEDTLKRDWEIFEQRLKIMVDGTNS